MLRPATAALAVVLLAACGGTPTPPPPTKVTDARQPPGAAPRVESARSPFRHPDKDPPPPRSQPQIPAAEIDAALAAAAAARAAGDTSEILRLLNPCANKVPKHTRCEGELALALAVSPHRKAETRYYLEQAIADDDPSADADFYRRLAQTLRQAPMWPEAAVAFERMIARLPAPTAADYVLLAETLQGIPNREADAAAALHRAFELAPDNLDHLRDEGLLLAQLPDRRAEALPILERYRDAIHSTEPDKLAAVDNVLERLRAELGVGAPPAEPGDAAPRPKKKPAAK